MGCEVGNFIRLSVRVWMMSLLCRFWVNPWIPLWFSSLWPWLYFSQTWLHVENVKVLVRIKLESVWKYLIFYNMLCKYKKILSMFGCGLINKQCVIIRFRQMVSITSLWGQRNNIQFMCKKSELPINSTLISSFAGGMTGVFCAISICAKHGGKW